MSGVARYENDAIVVVDKANAAGGTIRLNYLVEGAYDETFEHPGKPRSHYAPLLEMFSSLPADEIRRRKHSADLSFLNQGITFTVYGRQEGTERIFPYDLLPRLITSAEWNHIERGLTQRVTALNLFLRDIYNDGRSEWVITPELRGGPRVIIFRLLSNNSFDITSPSQPSLVANFFGIGDPSFRDGDRAALGDVNGAGILDAIPEATRRGDDRILQRQRADPDFVYYKYGFIDG